MININEEYNNLGMRVIEDDFTGYEFDKVIESVDYLQIIQFKNKHKHLCKSIVLSGMSAYVTEPYGDMKELKNTTLLKV